MRVVAGDLRGRRIEAPPGNDTRPTTDKVREAVFNALGSLDLIRDAVVVDLYAGTGALGIEALSRGARSCTFVDRSAEACGIVRRNLDRLEFLARGDVVQSDAIQAVETLFRLGRRYDLAFVGPPYYRGLVPQALAALGDGRLLSVDPVVVAEIHSTETLDDAYGRLSAVDQRRYGDNRLWFYRLGGESGEERGT